MTNEKDIRTFIAVEMPEEIKIHLSRIIGNLKTSDSRAIRWVPVANIHLTLRFLGDTSPKLIPVFSERLGIMCHSISPIQIDINGAGWFGSPSNPRVIWIGTRVPERLIELQKQIEKLAIELGFASEGKNFNPHLTLGRFNQNATSQEITSITAKIKDIQNIQLGSCVINQIIMFKSELTPKGSKYTPLHYIPFAE